MIANGRKSRGDSYALFKNFNRGRPRFRLGAGRNRRSGLVRQPDRPSQRNPAGYRQQRHHRRTSDIGHRGRVPHLHHHQLGRRLHGLRQPEFDSQNIGNIICLPSTVGAYSIDAACSMLLTQNSGSCQKNSAPSNCNQPQGSYSSVAPDCNYRTSSNAGTAASWTWTLVNSSGQTTLKCAQTGYQGTAP